MKGIEVKTRAEYVAKCLNNIVEDAHKEGIEITPAVIGVITHNIIKLFDNGMRVGAGLILDKVDSVVR